MSKAKVKGAVSEQVSAILQSIRVSHITAKTVRNAQGVYVHVYVSPNGPVPDYIIADLLKQRIITSEINDEKRKLTYRLTNKGRDLLRSLGQSGTLPTPVEAQA